MPAANSVVRAAPSSSGLYDVLDLILDKGLVIDAYVRVSVIGIEILTIDLRVVIASVDTYLRFAEAVDRLSLQDQGKDLGDLGEDMSKSVASGKTSGAIEGAKDSIKSSLDRKDRKRSSSKDEEE
jgi:gas vesicle structural protein